ncbi:hypothetical protein ACQEU6_02380 [Spirillospora sp. CA-108201]
MNNGSNNLADLTDPQYAEMARVSGGVNKAWYNCLRRQCPDVKHEEFVASQTRTDPWTLWGFVAVREVATAQEAEEVWEAAKEHGHADDFLLGYNVGRKAGVDHNVLLSADAAGVAPHEYARLHRQGQDHDTILANAGRQSDRQSPALRGRLDLGPASPCEAGPTCFPDISRHERRRGESARRSREREL